MIHGFIKAGAAVPETFVGAPLKNVSGITALIDKAYSEHCAVVAFPELCLTSATAGDLFFTETLLADTKKALLEIVRHTEGKKILVTVGCPVKIEGKL